MFYAVKLIINVWKVNKYKSKVDFVYNEFIDKTDDNLEINREV